MTFAKAISHARSSIQIFVWICGARYHRTGIPVSDWMANLHRQPAHSFDSLCGNGQELQELIHGFRPNVKTPRRNDRGGVMQSFKLRNILDLVSAIVISASFAYAATISGTVTGPDGAPFRAAFVQARNAKTKITVMVLSDNK